MVDHQIPSVDDDGDESNGNDDNDDNMEVGVTTSDGGTPNGTPTEVPPMVGDPIHNDGDIVVDDVAPPQPPITSDRQGLRRGTRNRVRRLQPNERLQYRIG